MEECMSASLLDDQYIYRFMSFYELYQLHKNNMLRLSLLSVQEDKNEGIGAVLQFASPVMATFHLTPDRVSQLYSDTIHNTYITCWSAEPESVAMWALYSSNKDGVRVRTTVSRLKSTLKAYEDVHSWTNHCQSIEGDELLTWRWEVAPVEYDDTEALLNKINAAYAEFEKSCRELKGDNPDWWISENGFGKEFLIFEKEFREKFKMDITLKDSTFSHEKEIRGVVHAGVRNNLSYEEWKRPENIHRSLVGSAEPGGLPGFIYAPVSNDFIDEICFDPRMPAYKKQVMLDALSPFDIPQAISRCFGQLLDKKFSFDPIKGIKRNLDM